MKKLILITAIGIFILSSCVKDEVDCNAILIKYSNEIKAAGTNYSKIDMIRQNYKKKYPNCNIY